MSEFATELLEKVDQGDGMLVALEAVEYEDLIDAELQEVREVLNQLLGFAETEGDDQSDTCIRARALVARLRVDGGKGE